ncbi:MAG TPA: hypothetical protein VIV11_36560 [Kofleriaceae bacterium]
MSAEEERWWRLIESSFPSVDELVVAMRALSRQELLELGVHIRQCRLLIREPWNGPDIPSLGVLSEDSTEDFTDWIVSQGEDYWRAANDGDDAHLVTCFELYDSVRRKPGHPRAWQPTPVVSLMGTLFTVWLERFEEDRFHDELDAAM